MLQNTGSALLLPWTCCSIWTAYGKVATQTGNSGLVSYTYDAAPVPESWVYYEELGNPQKLHFAEYDDVKHLENSRLISIDLIPFKIAMEILRLGGKDIKEQLSSMDMFEQR